jgi:hypothetical protein
MAKKVELKEGDMLLETGIGRLSDGSFAWRAKGERVVEFYQMKNDLKPELQDGWLICGPFKTEKAAERNLRDFERDYMEWAHPNVEVSDAPDPRSLN